jgi:hypothetical protein
MGEATMIGVGLSNGAGARVRVSGSLGAGEGAALSIGSGVALASGLIVTLGDGFAVAAGVVFGLAVGVGVGVSSETPGVLGWNGVEAASCARTNAAVASSTIARTNERM